MSHNYNVKIDDNALDLLIKKNRQVLTVDIKTNGGGCCPTFEAIEITFKKPVNDQLYNHFDVDGIDVYVSKTAKVNTAVLRIKLEKSFLISNFTVQGLQLKTHS